MSESADPKIGFAWKHPALILGQEHHNNVKSLGTLGTWGRDEPGELATQ